MLVPVSIVIFEASTVPVISLSKVFKVTDTIDVSVKVTVPEAPLTITPANVEAEAVSVTPAATFTDES